jgi:hypothetical protein
MAWIATQDRDREAARRALDELGDRLPHDTDLIALTGSAAAFAGTVELARRVYGQLSTRAGAILVATGVGCAVLDLYDRLLLELAARAELWEAIERHAETALAICAKLGSPVWTARVQADFADALDRRKQEGDAERAAELWARALSEARRLGMPGLAARGEAAAAISVRQSRAPVAAMRANSDVPADGSRLELTRSGELWALRGFGSEVHLKDSRGLQLLARLVEAPNRELHVLDLIGSTGAADGDAGPLLDETARVAYRTRLHELVRERESAETNGDLGRAERANAEIEALSAELERAFGLGGRERKAGSASERARSNVQRRIAHALEQVAAASPRMHEHLSATVRTGTYCVYAPAPRRR